MGQRKGLTSARRLAGTGPRPHHLWLQEDLGPVKAQWRRLAVAAALPALALLGVRIWLVEPVTVSSDSMEPTINSGAIVLLYKPIAAAGWIHNGAVVSFANPIDGRTAIKRVIAQEGQSVAIRDAELFVDNVAVPEPFIDHSRIDATYFGPVQVPAGHVFVLGDNRGISIDSRDFGAVPITAVQGILIGE